MAVVMYVLKVYHEHPVLCAHSAMLVTTLNSINLD
jgi:hypothetical protein